MLGTKDICPMGDVSKTTRESFCGLVCGRTDVLTARICIALSSQVGYIYQIRKQTAQLMRRVPLCTLRAENYPVVCAYFIQMSAVQCRYRKDTRLIREILSVIATA
jgi:hypothetical protein